MRGELFVDGYRTLICRLLSIRVAMMRSSFGIDSFPESYCTEWVAQPHAFGTCR